MSSAIHIQGTYVYTHIDNQYHHHSIAAPGHLLITHICCICRKLHSFTCEATHKAPSQTLLPILLGTGLLRPPSGQSYVHHCNYIGDDSNKSQLLYVFLFLFLPVTKALNPYGSLTATIFTSTEKHHTICTLKINARSRFFRGITTTALMTTSATNHHERYHKSIQPSVLLSIFDTRHLHLLTASLLLIQFFLDTTSPLRSCCNSSSSIIN